MTKMREQGASALSLQEKVWLKTYEEDSVRQSQQTWGGLVGTIIRQAPAFAAEFALTGGAFKLGTAAATKAAKETVEDLAIKAIREEVTRDLKKGVALAGKVAAVEMSDDVLKGMAKNTARGFEKDLSKVDAVEAKLFEAAKLQRTAVLEPKKFQGTVDFFNDYIKRGFLEHGDAMYRGAAPGIEGKLREAAGVAFVEAPIKGALYAGFDFFVANPLATRALGGDEAVTRSELMFASSQDPEIAKNAKMMAMGAAWMEYASENSGRAFNAIFGIVPEIAGEAGRRAATGSLSAIKAWVNQGTYVRKLVERSIGTYDEVKEAIGSTYTLAARHFAGSQEGKLLGKTFEEIRLDPKLKQQALKSYLAANDKPFYGFWLADKMVNQGWGPDTAGKWLRRAGYDDILGEFMEERYSGFAAGLFGFDGVSDNEEKSAVMDHLARAASGMFPDTWGQATAEIVAFAIPSAGRAIVNRGFAAAGAGTHGIAKDIGDYLGSRVGRSMVETEAPAGEPGGAIAPETLTPVSYSGQAADTAAAEAARNLGKTERKPGFGLSLAEIGNMSAILAERADNMQQDRLGVGARVAQAALGAVNLALTGDPMLMFRNPSKEILSERMGSAMGATYLASLTNMHNRLFNMELGNRSKAEAESAGKKRYAAEALTTLDREDIEKAIRPRMAEFSRGLAKSMLFERGTLAVEDSDIVKLVSDLNKENPGSIPDEAEFAKKFRAELAEVARNRMSVQFNGEKAVWSVERPEPGADTEMFARVDRFLADYGTRSYLNLGNVVDPHSVVDAVSGRPMPVEDFTIAAGITDMNAMTPRQWEAVKSIMFTMIPNPQFASEAGSEREMGLARDIAKQFLTLNKHLLLPAYAKAEGGYAVPSRLAGEGGFAHDYLTDTSGKARTFSTLEDMNKAAAEGGLQYSAPATVVFTPYNSYYSENPVEFAYMFQDYFKGAGHAQNPYVLMRNQPDGWKVAKEMDTANRLKAKENTPEGRAAKEMVETYDKAMMDALSAANVKQEPRPSDPSKKGYILNASALTSFKGDKIYIPIKQAASMASAIEDHLESAYKRNAGVFLVSEPGPDGKRRNVYRPAAREFISGVRGLLNDQVTEADKKPESERTESDKQYLDQVRLLSAIFDPDTVNIEAVSKSINALAFYMGDNVIKGIARRTTEIALYKPLGKIAREARELQSWPAFVSLASRLSGTGQLTLATHQGFSSFARGLIPQHLLDGGEAVLSRSVNPVLHVRESAEALDLAITKADEYLKDPDIQAAYAAADPTGSLLPEDKPAVVSAIRASLLKGGQVAIGTPVAPVAPPAVIFAAQEEEYQVPFDDRFTPDSFDGTGLEDDGPATAALAESLADPKQAAVLAAFAATAPNRLRAVVGLPPRSRAVALPGDDNYLNDAFEFWHASAPGMPEGTESLFRDAYAKATKIPEAHKGELKVAPAIADMFKEDFGDGDDREAADGFTDPEELDIHPNALLDNDVRQAVADSPVIKAARALLDLFNPGGTGDVASHIRDVFRDGISADGTYAPGGIADLLSGRDGVTVHPALTREGFEGWIQGPHPEKSLRSQAFLHLLESLGFEGSLRFLAKTRGMVQVAALKFDGDTGGFEVRARSSGSARESLTTFLRGRTAGDAAKAKEALTKIVTAGALPPLPTEAKARLAGTVARMEPLAAAADLLFGEGNLISSALRDRFLAHRLSRYVRADAATKATYADMWLSGHKGFPGLLAQRLFGAAAEVEAGRGADAAVDALFGDGVLTGDPSTRGAFNLVLNMFNETRHPGKAALVGGEGSLALTAPSQSETMARTLMSPELRLAAWGFFSVSDDAGYAALSAEAKAEVDRAVADMRRFAVWPDGTPVFANSLGADYDGGKGRPRREIGRPSPLRIAELLRRSYEGKAEYAGFQLPAGDKSNPLIVLLPRASLPGMSYDAAFKKVSAISGTVEHDLKRDGGVVVGYGAVVPAPGVTSFTLVTPEGPLSPSDTVSAGAPVSKEERGAMYGTMRVIGNTLRDNFRAMIGSAAAGLAKLHVTRAQTEEGVQVSTGFLKGVQKFTDEAELKSPGITETEKFQAKLHLKLAEEAKSRGVETSVLLDSDSAKEFVLSSKYNGVFVNGKIVPFDDWLSGQEDGVGPDTEVMWKWAWEPEPATRKLSEVLPGLTIRRNVPSGDGGKPVRIVTADLEGFRFQVVANVGHGAKPSRDVMSKPHSRAGDIDTVGAMDALNSVVDGLTLAYQAAHPAPASDELPDPVLTALVKAGLNPMSEVVRSAMAPRSAKRHIPKSATAASIPSVMTGDGDITVKGRTVRPYGNPHPLAREAVVENGRMVSPASVALNVNDPLFRYGMYADESAEAFKGVAGDQAAMAAVIRERLTTLDGFRARHDMSGYAAYLAESVMPMFVGADGKPFPSGRVFSFDDLFDLTDSLDRVFSESALRFGDNAPGDKSRVYLDGGRAILERVPGDSEGRAAALVRIYGPAATEAGTVTRRVAVARQQASGAWKITFEDADVENAPRDEAVAVDNAGITRKTGNDHDGDKAPTVLPMLDSNGIAWSYLDPSHITPATRARMIAEVTDPDAVKARRAMDTHARDIGNGILARRILWLSRLDQDAQGYTSADPISSEAKAKLDAAYPVVLQDRATPAGAARVTDWGQRTAQARASGVVGEAMMARAHLSFNLAMPEAIGPVLLDASGAPVASADFSVPPTDGEWVALIDKANKWSNAFFDGLKGTGEAQRYGMDRNLVNLHYFLLMSAKPATQEEYDAFMVSWAKWANGPQGRAILAHAASLEDPGYAEEFGPDPMRKMSKPARQAFEVALKAMIPTYNGLEYNDRQAVMAAAASYTVAGVGYAEAARRVSGLAGMYRFIKTTRAVMRVTELAHADLPTVLDAEKFGRAIDEVASLLEGTLDTVALRNPGTLRERVGQARELLNRVTAEFEGTYEASPLVHAIAAATGEDGEETAESLKDARGLRKEVMSAIYARAAAAMTSPAVGAKIEKATGSSSDSAVFFRVAETLYRSAFAAYSADKSLRGKVSVFHQLIAPYADESTNDVAAIMPASIGDAEYNLPALQAGLETLRNWPAGDRRLDATVNGVTFTPAEFYEVLRLYAAMSAPVSYKVSRSGSFIAAFKGAFAGMAEYQIRAFEAKPGSPEARGAYSIGVKRDPVFVRKGLRVADMFYYPVPWGSAAPVETPVAKPADPAPAVALAEKIAAEPKPEVKVPEARQPDVKPAPAANPDRYKGIKVVWQTGMTHPVTGVKLASRMRTNTDGSKEIHADAAVIEEQAAAKQWAHPRLPGVTALPEGMFSSAAQWREFLLEHEYQHTRIPRPKLTLSPEELAAYENQINAATLVSLGLLSEVVGTDAAAARGLAAINAVASVKPGPSTLPAWHGRKPGTVWMLSSKDRESAAQAAALLETAVSAKGVSESPYAEGILRAGAAAVRSVGANHALTAGTLLCLRDSLRLAGTEAALATADALPSSKLENGTDPARLRQLVGRPDVVFSDRFTDLERVLMYAVPFSGNPGFVPLAKGGAKTSELAKAMAKRMYPEGLPVAKGSTGPMTAALRQGDDVDMAMAGESAKIKKVLRPVIEAERDLKNKRGALKEAIRVREQFRDIYSDAGLKAADAAVNAALGLVTDAEERLANLKPALAKAREEERNARGRSGPLSAAISETPDSLPEDDFFDGFNPDPLHMPGTPGMPGIELRSPEMGEDNRNSLNAEANKEALGAPAAVTPPAPEPAVAGLLSRIEAVEANRDFLAARKTGEGPGVEQATRGAAVATRSETAKLFTDAILSGKPAVIAEATDLLRKTVQDLREGNALAGAGASVADAIESQLFDKDTGGLKWFDKDSDYRAAMIFLGNVEARSSGSLESMERADPAVAELLTNVRKALSRARAWIVASHSSVFAEDKNAILNNAEGDIPEQRKDLPALYAAYLPLGNGELDPETGDPDPWDRFSVIFADSDIFYNGAVMPFFRGQGIRDILMDKIALAGLPEGFGTGNFLTQLHGVGNDKGTILKFTKVKGAPWKADGKGGYEFVAEADRGLVTKAQRGTILRDVVNESLTPEEFALGRFFMGACAAYVGDGGSKAKVPLSGSVSFTDLPKERIDVSLAGAIARASRLTADETGKLRRAYDVDILLLNARNNVPEAVFPAVEKAIQKAYGIYMTSGSSSPAARELEAIEAMRAAGFCNRRMKTTEDGKQVLQSSVLTVPAVEVEKAYIGSSGYEKLLRAGREAKDMTMEAAASLARQAYSRTENSASQGLGFLLTDAAPLHDTGTGSPFFRGTGFHSYLARKTERPPLPEMSAKLRELYGELLDTARTCFSEGKPVPLDEALKRAPRMVRFYADLFLKEGDALKTNLPSLMEELKPKGSRSLGDGATMWTLATEIYRESARRIHETAALNGTVTDTVLGDVPLYVFNSAIDAAAEENSAADRRKGMTWSEIYEADGALPKNMGIDEMVATHAQGVATAVRYRMAVNQALLAADERGMPLIYAEPGENNDDTVPDRMWGMIARWWSEVHSEPYDETMTGKENARRLFPVITKGKDLAGDDQSAGALRRYTLKDVKIPAGMAAFSRVKASADAPGDDTKGALTTWTGGEAANIMTQILAIPGYGHSGAALAGVNRILSWSKSLSVMASVFFPIATAFESPWAAVGGHTTILGLSNKGADLARKLTEGDGPTAKYLKRMGVDRNAPFMADILRLIGSDDPALTELKTHAILAGLSLADRSKNLTDHDRKVLAQDIKRLSALASGVWGVKSGRAIKVLLEGAMEESSEFAFEYIINATKLSVFAQMNNRLRAEAAKAGRWWDPVRDMRKWAAYINAEVGGIDPAAYAWATPQAMQIMKTSMFSWEWTLGAWEAGGGGVITRKLFGAGTSPQTRGFMFGRWMRMGLGVMIGIPMFMQLVATAIGRAAGDDKERKGDRWWTWQNEKGRAFSDFDITPFLRSMGKAPMLAEAKRAHPVALGLVPALTGDEGDMTSSRKRRYYMHFGKQGWEVAGWFEDPVKSMLGKLSMPVQRVLEGIFGITPSMGWEKDFKDLGFWERWTSLTPGKSALVGLGGAMVPFSLSGTMRSPEAGFLNAVGPIGKGMSKTRAEKEMARMFQEWGDDDSYAGKMRGRKGAWTELQQMGDAWLEALALNGYDPKVSLKQAIAAARKPLYERVHNALPHFPGEKVDKAELEAAARGLYRLDFIAKDLLKSIKARDKRQNLKRVGKIADITDEGIRSAFLYPYGEPKTDARLKRSAELGGDVRSILASDKVPKTMLGYRVLTTEELSADDLKFFEDNPESAGHFDKGVK